MTGWWDSPDTLGRIASWATWLGLAVSALGLLVAVSGQIARTRRDTLLAIPSRMNATEAALAPRSLSAAQRQELVAALSPFAGTSVLLGVVEENPEAMVLAQRLRAAFDAAGLKDIGFQNLSTTWTPQGIELRWDDRTPEPALAAAMEAALRRCGLVVEKMPGGRWTEQAGALYVLVGNKPIAAPAESN